MDPGFKIGAWLRFLAYLAAVVAVVLLGFLATRAFAQPPAPTPPHAAERFKRDVVRNARLEFGIDAPVAMLAGQVEQESGWDTAARSRVGALGLAQFMPLTAADLARSLGGPAEPLNAAWALRAQARYMHQLANAVRYPKECDGFAAALSAYNGGLGWHNRRRALAGNRDDFWNSVRIVNPGISESNQWENEDYPRRIIYDRQPKYVTWGRTVCL